MTLRSGLAVAALVCAWLAGCSLPIPKANEPIIAAPYDLGPSRPHSVASTPALPAAVSVPAVSAPDWMGDGIVYRLLYRDGAQPQMYTRSRWTTDPASLVTERLRHRLSATARAVVTPLDSARSDYTLRVELMDFSQSFEAPSRSHVMLRARASLISGTDRSVLAQRGFEVKREAQPDAQGAVKALTDATDVFLDELVSWTVQSAHAKR